MTTTRSHLLAVLTTLFALLALPAAAQATDQAFAERFALTARGDIAAVGNASLTCPASGACTTAQGNTTSSNNDFQMVNVDVDADGTTFNSSRATVALPAGSTLEYAGLYWAADTTAAGTGSAAPDATKKNQVRVSIDGAAYQTVTAAAADVLTSTPQPSRYRSFANITGLLPASGNAAVTVANIQAGTGTDRFAGWALLVAYRNSADAMRRLNIYDGLGTVDGTHNFSTTITPFQTPKTGDVTASIGLVAFEGDAGLTGENVRFNGQTLSDGRNPANNVMNSTMSRMGTLFTNKTPNYANQLGTDVDVLNADGILANNQSSAPLAFSSTSEYFMPSAFFMVAEEGPAVNTAGPQIGGTAQDGQTLTATPGTWSGTPTITYEYQWQRCDAGGANCVDVDGATGTTYELEAGDIGSRMRVVVVATNPAGVSDPATSPATAAVAKAPPVNLTVPVVSGTDRDGEQLTSTLGTWDGTETITYAYAWLRCGVDGNGCVPIAGADQATYTLTSADFGLRLRSRVTATNDVASVAALSAPTGTVAGNPPVNEVAPPVTGDEVAGQTLTAADGDWSGTTPMTFAYRWQRCDADGDDCADLGGATTDQYTLVDADAGMRVRVVVTATNAIGSAEAFGAPSGVIADEAPSSTADPTLSGTPRSGEVLTADPGDWDGSNVELTYSWERCDADGLNCVPIDGATDPAYDLTDDDVGHTIRSVVTATNSAGESSAATQLSDVIAAEPPANVPAERPSVSGTVRHGEVLTADEGVWTGTQPVTFTYQWQRCDADGTDCVDIADATGDEYELGQDDVGHAIRVVVTGTNAGGSATEPAAPSAAIAPAPPVNDVAPPVTGTERAGETVSAGDGDWSGTAPMDFTYQWQRCDADGTDCVDIEDATSSEYTLGDADAGHSVRVVVTATNDAGSETAVGEPTGAIADAPPVADTAPALSGTPRSGEVLTADPGDWGGSNVELTYSWQRCDADGTNCVTIDGATGPTYDLTDEDVGHTILAVVTGTNTAGELSESTNLSDVIAGLPPVVKPAELPTVAGTPQGGGVLEADHGGWTGTAPVEFTYQWQRCDADGTNCVDIDGATDAQYELADEDVGHVVLVIVTATNEAGTASEPAAPSGVVAPAPPVNVVIPEISGDVVEGETLTAARGEWTGTKPLEYAYQWQRCDAGGDGCADIDGATGREHVATAADAGHVLRVVVTATNAAGEAAARSLPTALVEAAPVAPPAQVAVAAAAPAPAPVAVEPLAAPACQQLAGGAKYRRLRFRGIGDVRVRAYTSGPATADSPITVTTQVTGGRARSVRYRLDGLRLVGARSGLHAALITPAQLGAVGTHTLRTVVRGRSGKPRTIVLRLRTVPCQTLFTALRWRTEAGFGLRLRVDSLTPVSRIAFRVPRGLRPSRTGGRRAVGFLRLYREGRRMPVRFGLALPARGRAAVLRARRGGPVVRYTRHGLRVGRLPAGTKVAELTLYRVAKVDGRTTRRAARLTARVQGDGAPLTTFRRTARAPR